MGWSDQPAGVPRLPGPQPSPLWVGGANLPRPPPLLSSSLLPAQHAQTPGGSGEHR